MLKKLFYATRQQNTQLDQLLMGKYGYLSQTLMQLAGVAIAQSIHQISSQSKPPSFKSIAILVGPGNNGGDGLVAARHLKLMSYSIHLYMFKKLEGKNANYLQLCTYFDIPHTYVNEKFPIDQESNKEKFIQEIKQYDMVVDAVFGFPFVGEMRQPYKTYIPLLKSVEDKVYAVDIPSGWDANEGNIKQMFEPKYLMSLGLPKLFSKDWKGRHFMGGRFVPESLEKEIGVEAPRYEGARLYMEIERE